MQYNHEYILMLFYLYEIWCMKRECYWGTVFKFPSLTDLGKGSWMISFSFFTAECCFIYLYLLTYVCKGCGHKGRGKGIVRCYINGARDMKGHH